MSKILSRKTVRELIEKTRSLKKVLMENRISSSFLTGSLGEYLVYQKILQKDNKANYTLDRKKLTLSSVMVRA